MVAGIAEELRQLPGVRIDLVTSPGRATYAEVEESEADVERFEKCRQHRRP